MNYNHQLEAYRDALEMERYSILADNDEEVDCLEPADESEDEPCKSD